MRLNSRSLAVALACSALAVGTATAAGKNKVSGAGHVKYPNGQREFSVSARQTGPGTEAAGRATVNNHGRKFPFEGLGVVQVEVNCLRVEGNVAFMSGVVDHSQPDIFFPPGTNAWFMVIDNGQGKNASPDIISSVFLDGFEPNDDGELEFWSVNDCTQDIPRPVGSPGYEAGDTGPNSLETHGNIRVQ